MTKVWNIKPYNKEQEDAIQALLNPEIDLVVLDGKAGSGKTLLAIAAGLEQVVETKLYKEILFTKHTIAVGDDIGFLPGDEIDKLTPWCGALEDNLEVLLGESLREEVFIRNKIKIKALQFMRGRSFHKKYVIIDECQNLTSAQLKVLLTRAGEDTKIVCLGDLSQIDNKKLEVSQTGLFWIMAQPQLISFIRTISLPQGERSRLATLVAGWGI